MEDMRRCGHVHGLVPIHYCDECACVGVCVRAYVVCMCCMFACVCVCVCVCA